MFVSMSSSESKGLFGHKERLVSHTVLRSVTLGNAFYWQVLTTAYSLHSINNPLFFKVTTRIQVHLVHLKFDLYKTVFITNCNKKQHAWRIRSFYYGHILRFMLAVTLSMRVQTSIEPCTLPEIRETSEKESQRFLSFLFYCPQVLRNFLHLPILKLFLYSRPTDQGSTQIWHLQSSLECQIHKGGRMRKRNIQERNERCGGSSKPAHLFHTRKIYSLTYSINLIFCLLYITASIIFRPIAATSATHFFHIIVNRQPVSTFLCCV